MSGSATASTTPKKSADVKKDKLARQQARNAKYLLSPKDFRERAVKPLLDQATRLVSLAESLGKTKAAHAGKSDAAVDPYVALVEKNFDEFLKLHLRSIAKIAAYQSTLYRLCGKRAEKARTGETSKARSSVMHRSIASFRPELYAFIKEAAASNEALKESATCATFDASSPLYGYMSPTYAAQFILAYAAANRSFSPVNGQYIIPDVLMKKHLGASVASVLASFAAKSPEVAAKFPGQFTFCKLQELIGFYRVKPVEGSPEDVAVKAVRKNEANWDVLASEFSALSKTREEAFDRLHAERPKVVVVSAPKGPRKLLSDEEKLANKIRRDATAMAKTLGYKLTMTHEPTDQVATEVAAE